MASEIRIDYARYGIGTSDQQEAWPVKARKPRTCTGCSTVIAPGDVFVEARKEAFQTGWPYCQHCLRSNPQVPNVGARVVFGIPDTGRRLTW